MTEVLNIGCRGLILAVASCVVGCVTTKVNSNDQVIVSAKDQKMALVRDGMVAKTFPVSTSKFGLGDKRGSYATPIGALRVKEKIGTNARVGSVFKHRRPTGEVLPINAPGRDPIVTRIMWLEGLEGRNKNAYGRCIYIHGTPEEKKIGRPVSFGCIRMKSQDVVELFDQIEVNERVYITPDSLAKTLRQFNS